MVSVMNKYTLMKESMSWLYRFVPSDMSDLWKVDIGQLWVTLKESCSEMMMIIKYISQNKKATMYDLSALFSPDRRKLILSAANNHTFVTKIDQKNQRVKFESLSDQADVLPLSEVNLAALKESQKAKHLLIADLVIESTIFALNVCGFKIPSLNKMHDLLQKVREILQSKDLISLLFNLLKNTISSSETSKVKLVFNVLHILQEKGVLLQIIRVLLGGTTGYLDIGKAFVKVTVLLVTETKLPFSTSFAANLLKGSELLEKIETVKQIFVKHEPKSKL